MEENIKDTSKIACSSLRTVASSNLQLYTQADRKAQILIQVNSLMITVLLSAAIHLSEFHRLAIIPVAGQILFSLTIVFISLRSTRPARMLADHAAGQAIDLLYFGDYDHMSQEEYMTGMKDMLEEAHLLYASLMRDVYYQSQVLARKYHYLDRAYLVFIVGLGVNVLAAGVIALY